jgi:DNA-binding GntR family transcriptional regulator
MTRGRSDSTPAPLERRHVTKQQFVYQTLRDAILRCEFQPGERLHIGSLAQRLGVSIVPIREAFRLLESEGFIVNVAHVGATVAAISRQSVVEIYTILEGLESVSTRVAAQLAEPGQFNELEDLITGMDEALAHERADEWSELNARFHLAIGRLAAMPMLEQMLQRALAEWARVSRHLFKDVLVHRANAAQREHRELLARMRARDLDGAEQLVRRHNQGALAAYAEYLEASTAR